MPEIEKNRFTYKKAGVDINKATDTLKSINKYITSTFNKNVLSDLSSFAGLFNLDLGNIPDPVLVSSTDGVGTKILLAKKSGDYKGIGQDLVAMCINDVICCGAIPLFFLDYIACGKIKKETIAEIIKSVADSCKKCNIALIGGETAEMPGMYGNDDVDLSGFVVGIADKKKLINKNLVKADDILIGIASSGIHSNGFSLVREIIDRCNLDLFKNFEGAKDKRLIDILMAPTKLYSNIIKHIIYGEKIDLHGIANITGGGFYDNIERILPVNMDAEIGEGNWEEPPIFSFLQKKGNISKKEMFHVFNMGVGMVLVSREEDFKKIEKASLKFGEEVSVIGKIRKGNKKVRINFSE